MTSEPISNEERLERTRRAFQFVSPKLDALILFDDQFVQYFSGFFFIPTERPVALIITRLGERTLFVPRLEREHALATCQVEHILDYPEYPGEQHPMQLLVEHLSRQGIKRIGVDYDGYPPVMGYRACQLSKHLPTTHVSTALDRQMAVKSEHELHLIRESIRWGHYAHELLQKYTQPGLRENDVVARACKEATAAMTGALGRSYRQQNKWISGALAIYRGQIGPNSALPHAMANNATFQVGDTLVTGAGADVWGYLSELERTMFVGETSPVQQKYFRHMLNLQDIAFEQIKAGLTCASVDRAVRAYYEREGLTEHWRHHVGHSLGQRIHESPFLDIGDDTVLEVGMVLSVEPGIYVPGLGGFRHSDTVLVTDDGVDILTFYPRELGRLIIPVAA
jgi:Xaa-Pro dipeptidase